MLSFFAKLMLTFSALAPVALIYAYVALTQDRKHVAFGAALAAIAAVGFSLLVLHLARTRVTRAAFTAKEVEAADGENIGFMLLYLLPLFTDKLENMNWQLWVPTLALFALLIGNGYAHHFNPLLGLAGWHFYKVKGEEGVVFILITKKRLANATAKLEVAQLTDNILYDLGGKFDHHAVRVLPT